MLAYQHSGFSVDAGVCIEAHDRAALERRLRYCARPPFAMDRLRKEGAARGTQALTGALSVGGFDSPYLRGVDWALAAQPAPDYEIDQRVNG